MNIATAAIMFVDERETVHGLKRLTVRSYRSTLATLFRKVAGADVRTLNEHAMANLVRAYVHGRPAGVREHTVTVARLFCKWLLDEGHAPRHYMRSWTTHKRRPNTTAPFLTYDQVVAISTMPDPATPVGMRDTAMILVTFWTAARITELPNLRTHHVHAVAGVPMDVLAGAAGALPRPLAEVDGGADDAPERAPAAGEVERVVLGAVFESAFLYVLSLHKKVHFPAGYSSLFSAW